MASRASKRIYSYVITQDKHNLQSNDLAFNNALYDRSKRLLYNSLWEFIDEYYNELDREDSPAHNITAQRASELKKELDWLDERIDLERVYPVGDAFGYNFWYCRMLLERIYTETNKRPGGRPTKLEKQLLLSVEKFCTDVNNLLKECLDGEIIKTWELSGLLINQDEYMLYDQDGLNKFIKSIFGSSWIQKAEELELHKVIKVKNRYYLPKN